MGKRPEEGMGEPERPRQSLKDLQRAGEEADQEEAPALTARIKRLSVAAGKISCFSVMCLPTETEPG